MRIRIIKTSDRRAVDAVLEPAPARDERTRRVVTAIVRDVRAEGDRAVRRYARRFDALEGSFEVTREEVRTAASAADPSVVRALRDAARRIRLVAERQVPRGWTCRVADGVTVEQRVSPLDRVGCYVPGGRYPLPSTLLMTVVPAVAAGVRDIVVACPRPDATVFAAACEAGVTTFLRIGGAQAIAALAYGTETIARVDKIVGPGNRYVAAAKALVAPDCAIDFQAGPSEIVVVAGRGRPHWIAADLLAQAEHDPDARALFITWNGSLARQVADAVGARMPSGGPAREALDRHGAIIVARSRDEGLAIANRIAPEHLVCEDESTARRVRTAGTVFIGPHAAQAAGDYATGSNHVLPTAGAARFRGGLSAADFLRVSTVQRVTRAGLARVAPTAVTLARAEGLEAHARSIEIRLE
jgi:histidinol dehydrogenase